MALEFDPSYSVGVIVVAGLERLLSVSQSLLRRGIKLKARIRRFIPVSPVVVLVMLCGASTGGGKGSKTYGKCPNNGEKALCIEAGIRPLGGDFAA